MPFCPKCQYEYKESITECADCGEKLVDSLPENEPPAVETVSHEDWVALARLTSSQLGEMVLEGLRAKNIPAVINSTGGHFGQTGQLGPSSYRPVAGGYIVIMVPREFANDADQEASLILGEEWEKVKIIDTGST